MFKKGPDRSRGHRGELIRIKPDFVKPMEAARKAWSTISKGFRLFE
jgi:hypothetical protein